MNIQYDFLLSDILFYKIGGRARYFLECNNTQDILYALDFLDKKNPQKLFVCGSGSNLIFTDDYYDGAVIWTFSDQKVHNGIRLVNDGLIEAYAGNMFEDVISFSFDHDLIGLEWAGGLPGSVGGGVRGNAGAFGGEVKDTIVSVDVIDYSARPLSLKTLTKEELQFVYRGSLIKDHKQLIVVSALFQLQKSNTQEEIIKARETNERNIQYRKDRHPLEYPSCGSTFKNIRKKEQVEKVLSLYPEIRNDVQTRWYEKVAVAYLLEKFGFRGYRIGDAQISEKHALFIVNLGHAKAKDVLQIIHDVQDKFQETFGFTLELEAEIVV